MNFAELAPILLAPSLAFAWNSNWFFADNDEGFLKRHNALRISINDDQNLSTEIRVLEIGGRGARLFVKCRQIKLTSDVHCFDVIQYLFTLSKLWYYLLLPLPQKVFKYYKGHKHGLIKCAGMVHYLSRSSFCQQKRPLFQQEWCSPASPLFTCKKL